MKKVINLALAMFLLFILVGCGRKTYTEIDYVTLQNKIKNKESFILVIGANSCSACARYKTTMESVIKDTQIEIFYIDLDKVSDEENAMIHSIYSIPGTPQTLFFVDGEEKTVYDRINGAGSYTDIMNHLRKYGYVEE